MLYCVNSLILESYSVTRLSPSQSGDRFAEELTLSVDEAIKDLLGVGVVNAFYGHLAANGVAKTEISAKLDRFCSILEGTFGLAGLTIQRGIAMRFYRKLGLEFELMNPGKLTEYVREAERRMKTR